MEELQGQIISAVVALLGAAASWAIVSAQSSRETVRDASGRIVQSIEHRQDQGGRVTSVIRDASGRIIGTTQTSASTSGQTRTQYRDAQARITGTAQSHASALQQHTQFRDATGRLSGTAVTRNPGSPHSSQTQFRDASGRLTGNAQTRSHGSGFSQIQRDARGRITTQSQGHGVIPSRQTLPLSPPR
jgi:hypothetical protein